jgi:hypothetical protein
MYGLLYGLPCQFSLDALIYQTFNGGGQIVGGGRYGDLFRVLSAELPL